MTKKEVRANLNQLPAAIIRRAYHIEVVAKKAILQYDEFIEVDLKQYFDIEDEDFLYFDCFGWRIVMEKANG